MNAYYISIIVAILIIVILLCQKNIENFSSEIASIGSMPKNNVPAFSGLPLFLNFYPRFGNDYRLFDIIQKSKLNNLTQVWNGIYKRDNDTRNIYNTKKLSPIILIPGLGASPLYARWNKTSGSNIQVVDETNNFQQPDAWMCKTYQNSWLPVWPPNISGLAQTCWENNLKVSAKDGKVINSPGVEVISEDFGSVKFANDDYMSTLIEALESLGYQKNINLFAACYDFRTIGDYDDINNWCLNITKLIELNCSIQENPAIIIGHDLGCVIANYFLVGALPEWKNKFISKFINISGTFGGTPKALRTILSKNSNEVMKSCSGLSLMLPNPMLYEDNPLIHFNQIEYSSKNIPEILKKIDPNKYDLLNLSLRVRDISMNAPGVEVHILAGTDINTECSYRYNMSLLDEPDKNVPFYQLELPFNQKFNYNDCFQGDGTMPKFCLEYPISWSKKQEEPVYFRFFTGIEHTKILSTFEPVKYIVDIIKNNQNYQI